MPQYYLIPKRAARAFPGLEKAAMWLEAQLFRLIFASVRLMSIDQACRLSAFLFRIAGPHSDKAKKVRANLKTAFPDMTETELDSTMRDIFSHVGAAAAELLKMPQICEEWEQRIEYVVDPESLPYLESGPAGVYVTAHVSGWQMTPIPLQRTHLDKPMGMVYAPESNPYLHELFLELRQALGTYLIPTEAGVRPLVKELNNGASLALAVDTRLQSGKLVPFFGVDALTNTTPARMALKAGGPLIPVRGERLAYGKYRITVQKPIKARNPDASLDDRAYDMTAQVNQVFEEWIRETPGEWMCLKRRWPKAHKL